MKKYFLITIFFTLNILNAQSQNDKENNIRDLLDLVGTRSQISHLLNIMIESYKDIYSEIDDAVWDSVNTIFTKSIDGLYESMIPIYTKYYSDDEILLLIDFYKTPIGQKSLIVQPKLTEEGAMAGQEWGQSLQPKILEAIEKYYGED